MRELIVRDAITMMDGEYVSLVVDYSAYADTGNRTEFYLDKVQISTKKGGNTDITEMLTDEQRHDIIHEIELYCQS